MTHAEVVTLNDQTNVTSHVHSCDSERTGRRPYLSLLVGGPDLPAKEAFAPLATRAWTPQYSPPKQNRGPLLLICVLGVVLVVVLAVGAVVLLCDDDRTVPATHSAGLSWTAAACPK
jgi:hypothetical protein